jgi:hypothetical protein
MMHMTVETDELMKGTRFEGFKHEKLSRITAIETQEWVKVTYVNG